MNAFDFDDTIFRGDSTVRFFLYCYARTPRLWLTVPAQLGNALMFVTKRRPKQEFKERMYRFLQYLPDVDAMLNDFWDKNIGRIKPWYTAMQQPDDIVISASPEFLVRPATERIGIRHMMASPVDRHTGKYGGLNCHGAEKVRRFREKFPDAHVEKFYSDSYSDTPMAMLADEAFIVKGDALTPWEKKN